METNEISDFTTDVGYNARKLSPEDVNLNWDAILPLLHRADPGSWNGVLAKLLAGDSMMILVTKDGGFALAAIFTIGTHGSTEGLRTCFVDAVSISPDVDAMEVLRVGFECLCDHARAFGCEGLVGDTPDKRLVSLAGRLGFKAVPMYKLTKEL